jgi:hypothetical protein
MVLVLFSATRQEFVLFGGSSLSERQKHGANLTTNKLVFLAAFRRPVSDSIPRAPYLHLDQGVRAERRRLPRYHHLPRRHKKIQERSAPKVWLEIYFILQQEGQNQGRSRRERHREIS